MVISDKFGLLVRASLGGTISREDLNQFFNKNYTISIGEHRHKHHELIHAWAEGSSIERYEAELDDWAIDINPSWLDHIIYRKKAEPILEYRLKILFNDQVNDPRFRMVKESDIFYVDKYFTPEEFMSLHMPIMVTLDKTSVRVRDNSLKW
jgi:hypothetical protein